MNRHDDEFSVIGDKGEVGFIDFDNDPSIYTYNLNEEGPVAISFPFPMVKGKKPRSIFVGETSQSSITIHNRSSDEVQLWGIKIFASNPSNSFTLSVMEPPSADSDEQYLEEFCEYDSLEDRVLQPDQILTIWLSCKPKEVGMHTSIVHFDLEAERIERVVFLLADDKVSSSLASQKPYSRGPRQRQFIIDETAVSSSARRRKPQDTKQYSEFILPEYPIPDTLRELISNNKVPEVLHEGLTTNNYSSYFTTLIVMEELHLEKEMRRHNMECVTMKERRNLLSLEVPGLAEKRPSLVQGDLVYARLALTRTAGTHRGFIYRITADEVLLKFSYDFHHLHCNASLYDIQFAHNRVNMRRLYQAVEAADNNLGTDFIFPMESRKRRSIKPEKFVPFSSNLNEEQKRSVGMILGCKGAPPYVIYGPPGTGKTMTLVEAILQIYTTRSNSRVLVCAASNSAADHILQKLISNEVAEVKDRELFRLNATGRPYEDIQEEHIRFCFFDESSFRCPPLEALMRYRIIVCTYMSSSMLRKEGISSGHFSHIFLDEAGQASEPDSMVPIANLCKKDTVVVLAGDPKQLGPVIYSKHAETLGLGKSYLERLFECQFYKNEDGNYVTKLVRNYRCHPAILDLPSKLFYEGDLLACKEDGASLISSLEYFLPNKKFPILFMGIQGLDEREGNNPSWFNRIEASKVVDTINRLQSSFDFSEADIGVITPYRQQVIKIKQALEANDVVNIKVGSVEQFQGQEREVIIVSTVRSTFKHNEFDRTHCLGFLSNPRRFNVAITRARSLLVVIGNPHIVCKDEYWDKLLRYCSENCSYQGCPLPETREDSDEEYIID